MTRLTDFPALGYVVADKWGRICIKGIERHEERAL